MKRYLYIYIVAILATLPIYGEQLFTADFAPYEMRKDAEQRSRTVSEYYSSFKPKPIFSTDSTIIVRQIFPMPDKWSGRSVVLHIEDAGAAYDLVINEQKVLSQEDGVTPANVDITNYLSQGVNRIDLTLRESEAKILQQGVTIPKRSFVGSYLSAQPQTHIHSMDVELTSDSTGRSAVLNIEVVMRNNFSRDETLDVGYDIYDPSGKLLNYSVNTFEVKSNSMDTIRFTSPIYEAAPNRWSPAKRNLYKVMIYTKRNGIITEYIPRSVGFISVEYRDNKLYNFGEELNLSIERYNSASDRAQSRKDLLAIKSKGRNTIATSYPQPLWFYELCTELGLWVIDQISINSTHSATDRSVGGTPSNDPTLVDEYLNRAKACYSRSSEFRCVIAYSLGGDDSGNGYNMYRVYEWLKSVERRRPIIYGGARGEWNSDTIE